MSISHAGDLEHTIAGWCRQRPDIRVVIVIGSRGRPDRTEDQYSDLDLILFSTNVDSYVSNRQWLRQFGDLWIATLNRIGPGDPEWMAFYYPGIKADFLLVSVTPEQPITGALQSLPYQQVLDRGFRLLYQAAADAGEHIDPSARKSPPPVPSEEQFSHELNAALFTAARFVKFSLRGDTWRSQYTFDAELKSRLLPMIEWHAQLVCNPEADTWYEGRNMASWADRRVITAMDQLAIGPMPSHQREALESYLALLQLLASEIALQLGYNFPTAGQRSMVSWLLAAMRPPL